jgi:RNA polymerase sigma factor (TIGR02999 family)
LGFPPFADAGTASNIAAIADAIQVRFSEMLIFCSIVYLLCRLMREIGKKWLTRTVAVLRAFSYNSFELEFKAWRWSTSLSTTQLLVNWGRGDRGALDELTPRVYRELHSLARSYLKRERVNHTLQPTALISELYVRLIDNSHTVRWNDRSHFFGIAARIMRQILVEHARAARSLKRGGGVVAITLEESGVFGPNPTLDILTVDEALNGLGAVDARKARVVELRYFGGLSYEEIALVAGLSLGTVKRDLRLGEAWLHRFLLPPE